MKMHLVAAMLPPMKRRHIVVRHAVLALDSKEALLKVSAHYDEQPGNINVSFYYLKEFAENEIFTEEHGYQKLTYEQAKEFVDSHQPSLTRA